MRRFQSKPECQSIAIRPSPNPYHTLILLSLYSTSPLFSSKQQYSQRHTAQTQLPAIATMFPRATNYGCGHHNKHYRDDTGIPDTSHLHANVSTADIELVPLPAPYAFAQAARTSILSKVPSTETSASPVNSSKPNPLQPLSVLLQIYLDALTPTMLTILTHAVLSYRSLPTHVSAATYSESFRNLSHATLPVTVVLIAAVRLIGALWVTHHKTLLGDEESNEECRYEVQRRRRAGLLC